jgi:8-oxo-dGTP pyrophosphatase MutT (NUDIX family)
MSCYLLVYQIGPPYRVVLAHKKIYGRRLNGAPHEPLVWNGCGQLVIPGGQKTAPEQPRDAALREFYEETGLDFRVAETRGYCQVRGGPLTRLYGADFSVTYVRVTNADLTQARIAENIANGAPHDDELQDVGIVEYPLPPPLAQPPPLPVDGAGGTYWRIGALAPPPTAMPAANPARWRYTQYQMLDPSLRARAARKMAQPADWFIAAINDLPLVAELSLQQEQAAPGGAVPVEPAAEAYASR